LAYQKEMGVENLLVRAYIPSSEMASLIDLLTDLARENFITNFSFVELDIRTAEAYTVISDLFEDGQWKFEIPMVAAAPLTQMSR
jgi:hypothetical protein